MVSLLRTYLQAEGFDVYEAFDGSAGLETARRVAPDVTILDWMLPELNGADVLRAFRLFSDAYVIMLTARSEEADKVVGFGAGADDYLTKPFSPGELVLRIRAMMRRPRAETAARRAASHRLELGALTIDPARREARLADRELGLTAMEFDLLLALASQPGIVFSRAQLLERLRGERYLSTEHVIDVHVANLRRKLERDPTVPLYAQTVRGVGYKFVPQ